MISSLKRLGWCLSLSMLLWEGCSGLNSFQEDGELQLAGLKAPVTVRRDEKGMPYIFADNLDDALMAQGFVMAQDRLFNMEQFRRLAAGRMSEIAGEKAVALDTRMRTIGFYRHAQKQADLLDPDSRRFIEKFITGVNAFIESAPGNMPLEFKLAGIKAAPWTLVDPLAIMFYLSWDTSANLKTEIIAQLLVDKLGPEKAAEIFPLNINPDDPVVKSASSADAITGYPGSGLASDTFLLKWLGQAPLQIGSNNWAVDARRAAGNKPIVANDPHMDPRILPGLFYPCGIITPELRIVGVSPTGIPGMVIFRNLNVALGLTNAYGDTQDLYVETVDPDDPDRYLEGRQSIPFKIIEETLSIKDKKAPGGYRQQKVKIRLTARGPVVSGLFRGLTTDKVLSLRWSLVEDLRPEIGFDKLMRCRSVAEIRETLKQVKIFMLNFTFADSAGNIGWQVSGHLPIRSGCDGTIPCRVSGPADNWRGWVPFDEMPQQYNPAKGWVGTCNHYTVTSDYPYYYSSYVAGSYRYRRLKELLNPPGPRSASDHWQYQRDTLNLMAKTIAPLMAAALLNHAETRRMGQILSHWNYHDDTDISAPTIFQAVYVKFALLVFEDELGRDLTRIMLDNWYFWQERLGRMVADNSSSWFDNVTTATIKETRDDLFYQAALAAYAELESRLGGDLNQWLWGKVHRLDFVSPVRPEGLGSGLLGGGSHPAIGSGETLARGIYDFNHPFEVTISASLRMVADLSDQEKVLAVLPGGVSGRLFDKHTKDQIEAFINGDKVYWWFSDQAIQEHSQNKLVLKP